MLHGHMNLQRFDARGLTKEEIQVGIKAMGLDRFLEEIHKTGHWEGKNRILQGLPRCLFYGAGHTTSNGGWLNAPNPGTHYQNASNPLLWAAFLLSTETEPVLTEAETGSPNNSYVTNGICPGKRFDTDGVIDVEVFKDPTGREAAIVQQKFMWYPGESTSTTIRSVGVYSRVADDATCGSSGYNSYTKVARWRIKDSGGVPVTLVKLPAEVLFLQYSLVMYAK